MRLFEDPLMRRELSGVARRWQTFAIRTLILGILAFLLFSYAQTFQRRYDYGYGYGYGAGTSFLADLSRSLFGGVFACLMLCLPLQAVVAAADLVCREWRNGTLGLLILTPLTPWRILLGKWKAVMAQITTVLLAAAPIDAACVFLGGVEVRDLLWAAALPLATAGFAAALTLLFSAMLRNAGLVMVASLLSLLAGMYASALAMDIAPTLPLPHLHPVLAALVLAVGRNTRGLLTEIQDYGWLTASLSAFGGSLVLLRLGAERLRGRIGEVPGPSLLSRCMTRFDAFFESINIGRVRFFSGAGGVWETRALLWKELRTRAVGKLRHAARLGLGLLLVAAVLLGLFGGAGGDKRTLFLWFFVGLLWLQAFIGGLSLFQREKEGRQWDVLLSTPLRAREILGAKLAGGGAALLPTALVGALYAAALTWTGRNGLLIWTLVVIPVGLFTLFVYVVSAAASLRCATWRGAFGMALVLLAALLVGLPVLARRVAMLLEIRLRTRHLLPHVSPAWYLGELHDNLRWGLGGVWIDPRLTGALPLYALLYAAVIVAVVFWMLARFDRLAGRA